MNRVTHSINRKTSIICCIVIFSLLLAVIIVLVPTINEASENNKTTVDERNTNIQMDNKNNAEMVNSNIQKETDSVYISEEESKELSKSIDESGIIVNTVCYQIGNWQKD